MSTESEDGTPQLGARVLVVDDDSDVLDLVSTILKRGGFRVFTASEGREALGLLEGMAFDAVVSDVMMPGMDGIALLRAIRGKDLDVSVMLLTGSPHVNSAISAVQFGALRYLTKPVEPPVLIECVQHAVRLSRMARLKREAFDHLGGEGWLGDRAGLEETFHRALGKLWMAYQPIVQWSKKRVYAYEALVRTDEPALRSPADLLDAAEKLGRLTDLGRVIREQVAGALASRPEGCLVFVNLHSLDLLDETLFLPNSPLARMASQVVLELTERASIEKISDFAGKVASLREMGYRMALDDLGAGYAGLTSFAALAPEIVKLDMSLVREVHREPTKLRLVKSMVDLCAEMNIQVISEGIELPEERDAVVAAGCDLLQGYLFGRPGKGFPPARFDGRPDILRPDQEGNR